MGGELHYPGALPPERIRVLTEEWLVRPQGQSRRFGEEKYFLRLPGFETQSSSHQASHHTEYAILGVGYTYVLPTTKRYYILALRTVKSSPVRGLQWPRGFQEVRFPDFITMAQDCGKVVSLTHRPPFTTRICSW